MSRLLISMNRCVAESLYPKLPRFDDDKVACIIWLFEVMLMLLRRRSRSFGLARYISFSGREDGPEVYAYQF